MELIEKKGFKKTEVGFIPEDWVYCTVGEAVSAEYIHKPIDGNHGNIHPKKSDFVETGIPFIMANNVYNNKVDIDCCSFITKKQADNLQKGFSYEGDVLLTHKGTVGNVAIVGELPCDYIMLTPQVTFYRTTEKLNNRYLKGYFEGNTFQKVLSMLSGGGTRAYIGIVKQKELPLVIPPTLKEQKAIATALSDIDDLIASLETLITKKQAIKQGAMQQLLTPKKNWVKTCLVELAENKKSKFDDGDWVESEHIISQGVRLIQTGNIGIGSFLDKGNKKYISEESFNQLNCKEVLKGDLLVCRLAEPAGRACIMPNIGEQKVITSVDVSIFRGNESLVNREFLSQIFTTKSWFNKVLEKVGGTTHKRISRGALGKIEIELPQKKEQDKTANILSDMDAEIAQLETKKAKYQELKQGMMQELLTGKTRLV